MAPSASKQKRLAEKAAKGSASTGKNTPVASTNGGSTPMTSLSANGSEENLADAQAEMKRLNLATDRSAVSLVWSVALGPGLGSGSGSEFGTRFRSGLRASGKWHELAYIRPRMVQRGEWSSSKDESMRDGYRVDSGLYKDSA